MPSDMVAGPQRATTAAIASVSAADESALPVGSAPKSAAKTTGEAAFGALTALQERIMRA